MSHGGESNVRALKSGGSEGSICDPLLCNLSPPVSKVRRLASIYTYEPASLTASEGRDR